MHVSARQIIAARPSAQEDGCDVFHFTVCPAAQAEAPVLCTYGTNFLNVERVVIHTFSICILLGIIQ